MPFGFQSAHLMILLVTGLLCIIPLLIVGVGVYILVKRTVKNRYSSEGQTALDILKMRYAKSEITEDQFHKMKDDLIDL